MAHLGSVITLLVQDSCEILNLNIYCKTLNFFVGFSWKKFLWNDLVFNISHNQVFATVKFSTFNKIQKFIATETNIIMLQYVTLAKGKKMTNGKDNVNV